MEILLFASQQWIPISVLLLLIFLFIQRESNKGGKTISYHELTRMINADEAVVIDVRDNKEFSAGHIAGARNIPYAKLRDRLSELETSRELVIVVVDKMGQHSGAAGREIGKEGYNVKRLAGGMSEWLAEKLPVIKS